MENPQKKIEVITEYEWNPFKPITIHAKKLNLSVKFGDKCKNWVMKNGWHDPGGFYTSYNLVENEIPKFAEPVVKELIPTGYALAGAWIQTYEPAGFHGPHDHDNDENTLSGCLYLSKGESTIFQNPLIRHEHHSTPVECGTVLYWHPALMHCSFPSRETRSILAFNLIDEKKKT